MKKAGTARSVRKAKERKAVTDESQLRKMLDEQQALARIRRTLGAELARRPPEELACVPVRGAVAGNPALCPRPLCHRKGECRPPEGGPCLNDPADRMRLGVCERVREIRRAGRAQI
jgi:hypothetical protein